MEPINKDIVTITGQSFATEKFDIADVRQRARLFSKAPDLVINQFLAEVIADFCLKTFILQKLIEIGDKLVGDDSYSKVLTEASYEEILTDEDYSEILGDETDSSGEYAVTIDLTTYLDGLLPYKINKIILNGVETKISAMSYIGYPGSLPDGIFYEIIGNSIKIFPVSLDDTIQIPVVLKTALTATEIPVVIEDYKNEIASGVVAQVRLLPDFRDDDLAFHRTEFKRAVSEAKNKWFRENSPSRVRGARFV